MIPEVARLANLIAASRRIMFVTGIQSLDLFFAGAWDFPNEGATSEDVRNPQGQPYDTAQLDDDQAMSLVFRPGLSTIEQATETSGRGGSMRPKRPMNTRPRVTKARYRPRSRVAIGATRAPAAIRARSGAPCPTGHPGRPG